MSGQLIADRYEIVKLTEDRFVNKAIVKDNKAYGKLRTILSINEHSLSNPNILKWFNSQSELFTSISSDHVVDFIDRHAAGEIMDSPVIIVEEPGITLTDLMARGAIAPIAAQNIITKILLGVNELHERGYLHLDIRPETIGVNESATEVKLLSLGNCVEMDSDEMSLAPNSKYGAAECYSPSLKIDRRTDIYSIGILFYEMLTGKDAFESQFSSIVNTSVEQESNTNWTNWHVGDKALEPLESLIKGIDPKLSDCVHKMIDKDQSNRYASSSTVINELNSIFGNAASVGVSGSFNSLDATKEKKKTPIWQIVGGGAAVAMSLGLLAFVMLGSKNTVDTDELNALVATAKSQQNIITTMGWSEVDEVVAANGTYNLAKDAWAVDDMASVFAYVQDSSLQYGSVIDTKAPEAMQELNGELQSQIDNATLLGVEGIELTNELTPDYTGLDDLEVKYLAYSERLEEIETAIKNNNRTVLIGSTQAQIDQALALCEQMSDACTIDWYQDELERTASLKPFTLDKMEVSAPEFRKYAVENGIYTEVEERNLTSKVVDSKDEFAVVKVADLNWANAYEQDELGLPVVHITYNDAAAYCEFVNKRLPTEAEWEYAASGHTRNVYPWGQDWDETKLHWAETADGQSIKAIGSFPASENGLFDLAGSVSEWTSSVDESGENGYIKGASRFDHNIANIRIAVRRTESLEYSGEDVGFRCAEDLAEWPKKNDVIRETNE